MKVKNYYDKDNSTLKTEVIDKTKEEHEISQREQRKQNEYTMSLIFALLVIITIVVCVTVVITTNIKCGGC